MHLFDINCLQLLAPLIIMFFNLSKKWLKWCYHFTFRSVSITNVCPTAHERRKGSLVRPSHSGNRGHELRAPTRMSWASFNHAPKFGKARKKINEHCTICLRLASPEGTPDIFNASFRQGIFPDVYKLAKVVPVFFKKRQGLCNCRSISLLNILSKLFAMSNFLDSPQILSPSQYGFRSGRSTGHFVRFL